MTKVTVIRQNDSIIEVMASGHTGYAVEGEDIVCAALSSIMQTALLGLIQVAAINIDYVCVPESGELKFGIPSDIDSKQRDQANTILETMLLGISDLYQGYSDFIDLEVR